MTNARTTGIGKDNTANVLESTNLTITLDRSTDLLRARGDGELALGLETVCSSFLGNRRRAGHVFVGRVGARANERDLEFLRPVVLLDLFSKLGKRGSQIGGKGSVDVRLELRQVLSGDQNTHSTLGRTTYNVNDLVVLGTLVRLEVVREALRILGNL